MSSVRSRVASSDWCASRIVVSVISRLGWESIHFVRPLIPSFFQRSRLPAGGDVNEGTLGSAAGSDRVALGRPLTSSLPLTIVSAKNFNIFVARSRRIGKSTNSGVWSINRVVASPAKNVGWFTNRTKNGMFVFTPRIRNSRKQRSIRADASFSDRPRAVTFTNIES